MKNQIIITIGRESGSGGHAIAKKVADAMGIACYDKKRLVEGTAKISGLNRNYIKKLDEKPAGFPFSGTRLTVSVFEAGNGVFSTGFPHLIFVQYPEDGIGILFSLHIFRNLE